MTLALDEVDPFELPDWLGTADVTWSATSGLSSGHRVTGILSCADDAPLACDLLAVDLAYPAPVVGDAVRVRVHQAWQHGQVLVLAEGGGAPLVLGVPGSALSADIGIEALSRLALAVGAHADRYAVHLQIGRERR